MLTAGVVLIVLSILALLYLLYTAFIKKTSIYSAVHSTISIVGLQLGMLALFFILTYFIDTQKEFFGTSIYSLILIYAILLGPIYSIPSTIIHRREEAKKINL
ncbi:MAG TPA: hypothetical protein VFC60_00975 [Tissierellaceae bacterium]|nr:hypothetical protein [Tissierellaceae bacterium]